LFYGRDKANMPALRRYQMEYGGDLAIAAAFPLK
jgi:hypothetical protein